MEMNAKMEQFSATNQNPVLSVAKDGTVLHANQAGEPLLLEWGVEVREKLPSTIGDIIQRVIYLNNPEKIEVNIEKKVYLVVFHPLPEQERVNISGFDISNKKEIETRLCEAYEQIQIQSEELNVTNEELRAQSAELHEAYELLHDSEKGFRALAENSPDLVARFDRQNHCLYANPVIMKFYDTPLIAEFYGWSASEFIDKTQLKLQIDPEMMKLSEKQRANVFAIGKPEAIEFHYTSHQGKEYDFDTRIVPELVDGEIT
jgi:PAS domain S-box-containing protein